MPIELVAFAPLLEALVGSEEDEASCRMVAADVVVVLVGGEDVSISFFMSSISFSLTNEQASSR